MRTLLLDNYDSYTFNLFQLFAEINGEEPLVVRNDERSWSEVSRMDYDNIVISPGPGRSENEGDFGICAAALLQSNVPVLGVCLGHQGLANAFGGRVAHAPEAMHGRNSAIFHSGDALFRDIPQGFSAVRYHSLAVASALPEELERTAWTEDGVIMGLRHRHRPLWGIQFHPESACTEHGEQLARNFISLTPRRPRIRRGEADRKEAAARPGPVPSGHRLWTMRLDHLHDPERVFAELHADDPYAFWLDSSRLEPGLSRYSFVGGSTGPFSEVVTYDVAARRVTVRRGAHESVYDESVFDYLSRQIAARRCTSTELPFDFNCGYVGYFGYELKADCGGELVHRSSLPDAAFVFADRLVAFDHDAGHTYLVCLAADGDDDADADAEAWLHDVRARLDGLATAVVGRAPASHTPGEALSSSMSRGPERYLGDIERCKAFLRDGESYEICLTNKLRVRADVNPPHLYHLLRQLNPAPYAAFLRLGGDAAVLSSSPERFLRIDRDRRVEAKPIKGTAPRGSDDRGDRLLRHDLEHSEKSRAENMMIVDLLRNDLGSVCEVGSVRVPRLMAVETYETVHQLVSTVTGQLNAECDALDCIRSCFPGGSMTGAPKRRTMEIIDTVEDEARGAYSGALGFIGLGGTADLSIVIRTIVVEGDLLSIGTGGAIVTQSDPNDELSETLLKAEAPLRAIALALAEDPVAVGASQRLVH